MDLLTHNIESFPFKVLFVFLLKLVIATVESAASWTTVFRVSQASSFLSGQLPPSSGMEIIGSLGDFKYIDCFSLEWIASGT